jgi:hypothetical protein
MRQIRWAAMDQMGDASAFRQNVFPQAMTFYFTGVLIRYKGKFLMYQGFYKSETGTLSPIRTEGF